MKTNKKRFAKLPFHFLCFSWNTEAANLLANLLTRLPVKLYTETLLAKVTRRRNLFPSVIHTVVSQAICLSVLGDANVLNELPFLKNSGVSLPFLAKAKSQHHFQLQPANLWKQEVF